MASEVAHVRKFPDQGAETWFYVKAQVIYALQHRRLCASIEVLQSVGTGAIGPVAQKESGAGANTIVIKKYANRRLYNTDTSSYVTLDHLCQMVKDDVEFVVYDAKTGEDITRPVLTQIIVEEEAKGQNLLPVAFLRQLISLYGDNMQWLVPRYLEHSMSVFAENQDRMRQYMQNTFGGLFSFSNLEEMNKQNVSLFENTMKMFSPFAQSGRPEEQSLEAEGKADGSEASTGLSDNETLDELKQQIEQLQKQLEVIAKAQNATNSNE